MAKFRIESLKTLSRIVKELAVGLRALTFADNFQSFETELTIAASSTKEVRNNLNIEPTGFIIKDIYASDRATAVNGIITKGGTWNANYVSFKNNATTEVIATIIVLR
jgi:hypothetical protein